MSSPQLPSAQRSIVLSAAAVHLDSDTELQLDEGQPHPADSPNPDLDLLVDDDDSPHPHPPQQPAAAPPPPPPPPSASSTKPSPSPSPKPPPPHLPHPPSSPSPPSSHPSLSSKSKELKEREQRVILPITAAPITRHNQDDTVVGIGPHHVDFDSPLQRLDDDEDDGDGDDDRDEIWYEEDLATPPSEPSSHSAPRPPPLSTGSPSTPHPDPYDREVSVIMSRTPSYSQQRKKELALVAAIKAERARHPDQIITSPPTTAAASEEGTPRRGSAVGAVKVSPTFSYPAVEGYDVYAGGGGQREKMIGPSSPSSSSPAPGVRGWGRCGGMAAVTAFSCSLMASLMFEFSAIVLIMHMFNTTLLPASLFGLSESVVNAFAPLIARAALVRWRGRAVLAWATTVQHVCIVCASVVFHFSFTVYAGTEVVWGLLWPLLALGMLAKLGLCVARSAMADMGEHALAMSRMELGVSLITPVLFGAVSTYQEPDVATLVVGGWSLAVLPLGLIAGCLKGEEPEGDVRPVKEVVVQSVHTPDVDHHGHVSSPPPSSAPPPSSLCLAVFHHPAFLPSLSYALLALSILAFSVDMIAYLSSLGVSDFTLGCGRALTTLIAAVPPLFIDVALRRLGSDYTGLIAVWLQVLLLAPIPVIFTLTDRKGAGQFLTPLFICLCFSSLSLSCFRCIESPLAPRSGPSSSADYLLRVMVHLAVFVSYGLTIVFFDPDWFLVPVLISFACVLLAAVVYSVYARRRGGGSYVTIGGEGEMVRVGKGVEAGGIGRGEEVEVEGEGDGTEEGGGKSAGKKEGEEEWEGSEDEHRMDDSLDLPHTPG